MSLIALAHQLRGQRAVTRTLLMMLAVVGAVIAGLLAMHSLNTHATTAGHGGTVAVSAEPAPPSAHHDASPGTAAVNTTTAATDHAGCTDCGDDHAMTWMACVLALLVSVILFARLRIGWRITLRDDVLAVIHPRSPASAHPVSPPSLTVLCISRT